MDMIEDEKRHRQKQKRCLIRVLGPSCKAQAVPNVGAPKLSVPVPVYPQGPERKTTRHCKHHWQQIQLPARKRIHRQVQANRGREAIRQRIVQNRRWRCQPEPPADDRPGGQRRHVYQPKYREEPSSRVHCGIDTTREYANARDK